MSQAPGEKTKVAILGGEVGAITTAFYLTSPAQRRHREIPRHACFQAVEQAVMRIGKIHGFGLLSHDYQVKIHHYKSTPVVEDLGLVAAATETSDGDLLHILKPRFPLWVKFDCTWDDCATLYRTI